MPRIGCAPTPGSPGTTTFVAERCSNADFHDLTLMSRCRQRSRQQLLQLVGRLAQSQP